MTTKRLTYQHAAEKVSAGTTLTATKLRKLCGIKKSAFPKTQLGRDQLRFALISAYTGMNKHLARKGMYIKSKNYYSVFTVLRNKECKEVVISYSTKANSNKSKAVKLGCSSGVTPQ